MNNCPYKPGDIVVFDCPRRKEKYIAQVDESHIKNWGAKNSPTISEATIEQKQKWFESGEKEVILESKGPMFMGVSFGIGGLE